MTDHETPGRDGGRSGGRFSRRTVLRGIAGAVIGAGAGAARCREAVASPGSASRPVNSHAAERFIWKLDRPSKPALPYSYFWTWDHSTNWMLDDPGILNFGCDNRYLKQPETYLEDYSRLTDLAAGLGVKGILIWGFLRDDHGGVDFGKRVADYAADKGVIIKPGVGTNWYGGVYYQGEHPYNIETFVRKNLDARLIDEQGNPQEHGICPTHPGFVEWLQEGVRWLFREFNIGGANLENGDYMVCDCPRCREHLAQWPKNEPPFWRDQYLGYGVALRAIEDQLKDKFVTWATYQGFNPGKPADDKHRGAYLLCDRPALVDKLPADAVCQWTLTRMVRNKPLPLTAYLDDGTPAEAQSAEFWPADVKPPTRRSVGFLHQASQWHGSTRYNEAVSTIKEGCLRAYRAGLEGVSIHGEVSTMHVPWALNYLAFSHFIHWPEDTLRAWGRKTLGEVLGSEAEGEAYAELFAHWQAGLLTNAHKKDLRQRTRAMTNAVAARGEHLDRLRFWSWLCNMVDGMGDRQTSSIF
ncbi:MAG: hypothetical protein IT282_10655 [Bacteroidetes bacterium]|nr:hypothetical protein [Bacteroidota bacterium]